MHSPADFAAAVLRKIDEKIAQNHAAMDAGPPYESYLKLVGRNQQLTEVKQWVSEIKKAVGEDDDDDD